MIGWLRRARCQYRSVLAAWHGQRDGHYWAETLDGRKCVACGEREGPVYDHDD